MSERQRGFLDEPGPAAMTPPSPAGSEAPARGWQGEAEAGAPTGPISHADLTVIASAEPPRQASALVVAVLAVLGLVIGLAILDLARLVLDHFTVSAWLGGATAALIAMVGLLLAWAGWREWRSWASLGEVEHLRLALLETDMRRLRRSAGAWLRLLGEAEALQARLAAAVTPEDVRSSLNAPLTRLQRRTAEAGRAAALQVLAGTAVNPVPALDSLLVLLRGLRLVRQVAALHGLRPGLAGTLRLLRRVTLDAAGVAVADVAVSKLLQGVADSPLGAAFGGSAAGAALAARRMVMLAEATAKACRPL